MKKARSNKRLIQKPRVVLKRKVIVGSLAIFIFIWAGAFFIGTIVGRKTVTPVVESDQLQNLKTAISESGGDVEYPEILMEDFEFYDKLKGNEKDYTTGLNESKK